jgi:hypothetical protein
MTKKTVTDIVGTIVDELTPLTSEERQRVIQASLTLLGEQPLTSLRSVGEREEEDGDIDQVPIRARTWMKQNGLSMEQLQQVFHKGDEGIDIIASEMPGRSTKEKVRSAYVLVGIAQLLSSGDSRFDDKLARSLCETLGIYDPTNHTKYLKGGNELAGTKDKGWTLTAPGQKRGAAIVAELSK